MRRTIIVTGANRGLGNELVKILLEKGNYNIIATARQWNTKVNGSTTSTSSSSIHYIELDITQETSRNQAIQTIKSLLLPNQSIDILVNNAGVFPQTWSLQDFTSAYNTNTIGPLQFASLIIPYMNIQNSSSSSSPSSSMSSSSSSFIPHIINVSSGLGKLTQISSFYQQVLFSCTSITDLLTRVTFDIGKNDTVMKRNYAPAYCLSKAALNRGTQLLAEQYKGKLRVSSVDPGWCKTDMGTSAAPRTAKEGAISIYNAVIDEKGGLNTGQFLSNAGVPMEW